MKKTVLFGAGKNAKRIIEDVGAEKVEFIVDNFKGTAWEEICGIRVYNFYEIEDKELVGKNIVITPCDERAKLSIMEQLMDIGCTTWTFFDGSTNVNNLIAKEKETDILYAIKMYRSLCKSLSEENIYLREHIKPKDLMPAKGFLRKKQLSLVQFAYEVFTSVKEINIHPILSAGNLLGLVRHSGFIPWDDDLDFKLIRDEYERLKTYCKGHFIFKRYEGKKGVCIEYMNFKKNLFEKYPDEYIFLELPEHCQILKGTNIFDGLSLDLFVIDSYKDDYSFSDHRAKIDQLEDRLRTCTAAAEQYPVLEDFLNIDREKWDSEGINLYYGGDNVESYAYYIRYKAFLKREYLLPLKESQFEGYPFFIPNNPEKCLEYVFGAHWKELPARIDYGHSYWKDFFERNYESADIVYDPNYPYSFFRWLYLILRRKNIYAKILLSKNLEINDAMEYFDEEGIEYSYTHNIYANIIYTDRINLVRSYIDAVVVTLKEIEEKNEDTVLWEL